MTVRRVRLDVGEPVGFVKDGAVELRQFDDDEMERLAIACGFDIEPWESGLYNMTQRLVADAIAESIQPPARRVAKELTAIEQEIWGWIRRLNEWGDVEKHADYRKPSSPDPNFHARMFLCWSAHFESVEQDLSALSRDMAKVLRGLENKTVGRKAATKLPIEHMKRWLPVFKWAEAPLSLPSKPVFDRRYPLADFGIEMLRIGADRFRETVDEHDLQAPRSTLDDALSVAASADGTPTWAFIQALTRLRKEYRQRER